MLILKSEVVLLVLLSLVFALFSLIYPFWHNGFSFLLPLYHVWYGFYSIGNHWSHCVFINLHFYFYIQEFVFIDKSVRHLSYLLCWTADLLLFPIIHYLWAVFLNIIFPLLVQLSYCLTSPNISPVYCNCNYFCFKW